MNAGRRERKLDSISDALLHACEEYFRTFEQQADDEKMDRIANSIQQLWKQRVRDGDDSLPYMKVDVVPSKQLDSYDTIYSTQFLDWVACIHKELVARKVSRYGSGL